MIYENVLKMCKKNNISISALEKELGFGKCTISRWKHVNPGIDKLTAVADYFRIPLDLLVKGGISYPIDGSLVVKKAGKAVLGCNFSELSEMIALIQLFISGKQAEVDISLLDQGGDGADSQ